MTAMSLTQARTTLRDYRCATCWGALVAIDLQNEARELDVHCANPDCSGTGFVTAAHVDRRRSEDLSDYSEAAYNLRDIIPGLKSGKSAEEIIRELGF
jgi:hypothetical protein